jgi:hypothetical protein
VPALPGARSPATRTRGAVSAGLATTALAVTTLAGIALALTVVAAPARSPVPGRPQDSAQLTAWTVTNEPGGVVDVTIRELKDPAGLQARLRADRVVSEPLSRLQGFTIAIRPTRMPHGTAFLIAARPTYVHAWGLVKTSPITSSGINDQAPVAAWYLSSRSADTRPRSLIS